MAAADADTALLVFAKAPQPGAVKTRLVPLLGPEAAAALQARLVERALETARGADFGRIELHCAPGIDDTFFRSCAARYGVALVAQAAGDLGARMLAAFEGAGRGHSRVLLMGSDCPALSPRYLRRADGALREGHDAVFGPCEDGGYALVGLKRAEPSLFEGIGWSGNNVMSVTRARLTALGWRWLELEMLWDVDRPEDYLRLMASGMLDSRRATA